MRASPTSLDHPLDNASFVSDMRPALVRYFKNKTGDAVEAEDLAQDVMLRALKNPHWKTADHAKGYIFRTAVNRWHDSLRRRRVRGVTVKWDDGVPEEVREKSPSENLPERASIAGQELSQVVHALQGMNGRTRTVLMLIKLEQMKIATVAEMLGISVRAVGKHLAKGIAELAVLRKRQEGS